MITTVKTGKETLTFGVYALRYFTERMGCSPSWYAVHQAFDGAMLLKAKTEMVRAGLEETAAEATGTAVRIDDYAASKVLQAMKPEDQEAAQKAFYSSILGQDYDEWFKDLEKQVTALEKEAAKKRADEAAEAEKNAADDLKKKASAPSGKS